MKKLVHGHSLIILIVCILFGAFLRFIYLDRVPAGISDDELDYVLTAKSVYLTGTSLDGTFSPFSFKAVPSETQIPYARAPYMLLSPFIGSMNLSLGTSRIPYVVISVLTMVVLIAFTWRLFGEKIALCTAFVVACNPWSIYFGRTAFEAPLSVFFAYLFLCALLFLKEWWLVVSIIPWIIGFYSYQGTNIIYPLMLLIGCIGSYKLNNGLYKKQYGVVIAIGISIFMLFILFLRTDRVGGRMDELAIPSSPLISSLVNFDRRNSTQEWFNPAFVNKVTVTTREVIGKYIGAFSTTHLFVSGEGRSTFSLWTHGLFYAVDFIVLLIGCFQAYRLHKKKTVFLFLLVTIGVIPAAITVASTSYALRASFMYPALCIFIGVGLSGIFQKNGSKFVQFGLILIYAFSIINFLHVYFIRNPVNNSEGFGFSNRILSKYLVLADQKSVPVLVIQNNPVNVFRQYIFYNDKLKRDTIDSIQGMIKNHNLLIGAVQFIECPDVIPLGMENKTVILPFGKVCPSVVSFKDGNTPLFISQLSDGGTMYEIYNDVVCPNYELSQYQEMVSFSDLLVEKMTAKQFCQTYLSRPSTIQ